MSEELKNACNAAELRRKAESLVSPQQASTGDTDAQRLLHELQIYQIELEMQNDELRRTIAEKNEHEAHLRNIIQQTPAGYFRLDPAGHILAVNTAWLRMHGYDSSDEVIGKHFSMMQVDSSSYSDLAHLAELQKGVPIPHGEFTSRRKDGSVCYHIFSALPVVHFGQIIGFEWFIIDISQRKQLLEDKLLLQQQFQQAQKLESLGVLAGGIAHDFNNILTVIISSCSLAQLRPHMAGELLAEIDNAAQRAAELCRQMLAYAGKSQLILKQVKLADLVEDMLRMLKATITQNVTITSDFAVGLPPIRGDASQLRQIVMNLVINAAESIGAKQGEIRATLAVATIADEQPEYDHLGKVVPAGQYVCLEVSDNGCGMDEETCQRVFEPFFTTKFTGRGLGMSAVLGIITAHKGTLQLLSLPGQGTIFKVYLPIVPSSDATGISALPYVPLVPWQGSGTVLLVEDEPQISMVAKNLIKALGFSVIEASNGTEALDLYLKNAEYITLVVTDIGMPLMDGYELFHKLKERAPDLPIIISSGFGDMSASSQIAAGAAAGYLDKPYSFNQLREVLKAVLERKGIAG